MDRIISKKKKKEKSMGKSTAGVSQSVSADSAERRSLL